MLRIEMLPANVTDSKVKDDYSNIVQVLTVQ